jgi:hypothetical protein
MGKETEHHGESLEMLEMLIGSYWILLDLIGSWMVMVPLIPSHRITRIGGSLGFKAAVAILD